MKNFLKSVALLNALFYTLTFGVLPYASPVRAQEGQESQQSGSPTQPSVQPTFKTTAKLYVPINGQLMLLHHDGTNELLVQDYLSSVRNIEKDGRLTDNAYYPYGQNSQKNISSSTTDKAFTSHRELVDAGVYHAGARFYNPQLGIFVQADKVQGGNRYAYANNNPALMNDPSGNCPPCLVVLLAAAFGAGLGSGYEHQQQINNYGSVQDPAKVVIAGGEGAAAGAAVAGIGYVGAVAIPAAIGAAGSGAGAVPIVGFAGGAQIATGACLNNPNCISGLEVAGQFALRGELPPGYSSSMGGASDLVDEAGLGLARKLNKIWVPEVEAPSGGLDPRYFDQEGLATEALLGVRERLLRQVPNHVDPEDVIGLYVVGSNRSGQVHSESDLDVLVYTRNTYYGRTGDENTYSPRATQLQLAMNPQIEGETDWMNFALHYKGLPSNVKKSDLIDTFVSTIVGARDGDRRVYDLLNQRWGNMMSVTDKTLILPGH